MTAYDQALQELSRAAPKDFIAERRRLAAKLRARDKGNAARLELRRKPTASVWAVNQLYWQSRDDFDEMMAAASSLRNGELQTKRTYREAIATLHQKAAAILQRGGLGASDATLRRVDTTLAAIAAAGGFDPNPPGALEKDLEPPGFDAIGLPAKTATPATARSPERRAPTSGRPHGTRSAGVATRRDRAAEERQRRLEERSRARAEQADRKRQDEERAARKAHRDRLERSLGAATRDVEKADHVVAARQKQLRAAEERTREAKRVAAELQRRLDELDEG